MSKTQTQGDVIPAEDMEILKALGVQMPCRSEALRLAYELEVEIPGFPEPTQLEAEAAAELLRLDTKVQSLEFAAKEWHEKTDWVQNTIKPRELGMHRADVLRARIEALDAENKALRERLEAFGDLDPALSRKVYRACEDLPEGWSIRIDLENGYGGVKLIDPDGEENELPVDGWLSDAMRESIAAAQAAAKGASDA